MNEPAHQGVPLARCNVCEHVVFPFRPVCPSCGSADWRMERTSEAVVEHVTRRTPLTKRRSLPTGNWVEQAVVYIASVRTPQGVEVTVKCDEGTEPGDRVTLDFQAHGTINRAGQMAVARPLHDPNPRSDEIEAGAARPNPDRQD